MPQSGFSTRGPHMDRVGNDYSSGPGTNNSRDGALPPPVIRRPVPPAPPPSPELCRNIRKTSRHPHRPHTAQIPGDGLGDNHPGDRRRSWMGAQQVEDPNERQPLISRRERMRRRVSKAAKIILAISWRRRKPTNKPVIT